jgi:2-polyprenyl-3-methyl-5-hydroxy-6-metoxy-1,4-benzoquinol methylase
MSADLLDRIRRKLFLDRAGYGRPLPREVLDGEYRGGAWAHFDSPAELPRQVLVAGLAGSLHPRPRVLDVGCGSGLMAELLQPHRPASYLGIDLAEEGLNRARARALPGAEFRAANFEEWRPESGAYDVVILSECVGYAHDPGALVRRLLPGLAAGGHVIVSYYRSGHWPALWRRLEAAGAVVSATTLSNSKGQTWDIKVLQPRPSIPGATQ